MTQVDALKIYFVLSKDDSVERECSPDMKLALELVVKCGGNTEWIKPSDCFHLEPQKQDVFVFDKFEGRAFETLKQNSSKILGVRCLITCLTKGKTIPPSLHPIYMEAMRNLFVASSGFDSTTKKQIQEKVQYMGGHYDNALRSIITHLVTFNNISSKAVHAYKNNIKIMKLSWIEDVWEKNLIADINGDDEVFDQHLSPLFHNLKITSSGINKREKEALKAMIESNGGHFMGSLEANVTNILLVTKPEGEKFRVANNWNIICVTPTWVRDCVEAKAILPLKSYTVELNKPKSSTPNRDNSNVNFSANFTTNLSIIRNPSVDLSKQVVQIDETASTQNGKSDFQTPRVLNCAEQLMVNFNKSEKNVKPSHSTVINNYLMKNVQDSDQFLDGLNIFLYGFQQEESEKIKKVLNKGGAVRFNEMSESVTHVIAGRNEDKNLANFAKYGAHVLSVDWLAECIKLKARADEKKFLLVSNSTNSSEPPSPVSKKGAQLLYEREGTIIRKPSFSVEAEEMEKLSELGELLYRCNASQPRELVVDVVNGARSPCGTSATTVANCNEPPDISSPKTSNLSSDEFFAGLTFYLSSDLSEEEIKCLEDLIVERRGQIVGKRDLGLPDFAIVPAIGALLTGMTAKEVVNIYFIKDCCVEGCLLKPRYYHQPVSCPENAEPLKNCVISVSNYVQGEREFMEMMIEALGGIAQSLLARKPKQGALKSTHLVCAEPQGQKYEGAVRWGLPVVHHDWLLKCAAMGTRVSEKPFLVGDSKLPPESDKSASDSTLPTGLKSKASAPVNATSNKAPLGDSTTEKTLPSIFPKRYPTLGEVEGAPLQVTPVHNALARIKATETPKSVNSPDPNRTVTPTSPYGAFYGKGSPTPGTRKRIWKWMNQGVEFPLDPPARSHLENDGDSTPISELISRHLEMLKRKPEELPPDSPVETPCKKLNLDLSENLESQSKVSVDTGLKMMKQLEEKFTKNGMKSPLSSSLSAATKKMGGDAEGRQMVIVSESQAHTEVGWEDPTEKELVLGSLEKAAAKMEAKPKVYMFSCIKKDLEELKVLIEESGGSVSGLPHFDKKATHLITGNLTRAEKLMGSIAAGLWVLHPSYMDALKKTKNVHLVSEEDYEWGSPKQRFRLNLMNPNSKEFALCSYSWRISIGQGGRPPFKDMKMLLHVSPCKYDSFKRLIEAGCGTVVEGQPPHYQNVEADVCVYEASNGESISFSSLAKRNVPCVALVYISDFLLKVDDALNKNLVPEFLQFWNSK